ncbi:MAG: DUF1080 domain-containing protein [Muribaculaceae bacterium]|nr:DUF1080 domain-containing protein [Muribaculaceae bacterium]
MNKFIALSTFSLLAVVAATAQDAPKEYPQPEKMRPGMSEYWTPQPRVVTPGDIITNSAPSDAIVLFDGKNLDAWKSSRTGEAAEWDVHDGVVTVNKQKGDIQTKDNFDSFQLHIEWMVPENITGKSQGRGNSGVFLQGMYEVQVLDCYDNETYVNGMTGSIYKQKAPMANVMRKPGEWNVYDIIYNSPVFNEDGTYKVHPKVTVIQNGCVIINDYEIQGTTEYIGFPRVVKHGDGPIILQSHGDPSEPISFRNIWLRPL